eukprot:COSAG02_NODE_1402_length_12818_cov_18.233352_4_plen_153_part_00
MLSSPRHIGGVILGGGWVGRQGSPGLALRTPSQTARSGQDPVPRVGGWVSEIASFSGVGGTVGAGWVVTEAGRVSVPTLQKNATLRQCVIAGRARGPWVPRLGGPADATRTACRPAVARDGCSRRNLDLRSPSCRASGGEEKTSKVPLQHGG